MTQSIPSENYYLDYFRQMVHVVEDRYGDILSDDEQYFIAQLKSTSETSLRLLIRLYLRKGPNFLVEKLSYAEVPDIEVAIQELIEQELLEENPEVFAYELIELLPIARSRELFSDDPKIRKSDLLDLWLDDDELQSCQAWHVEERIITPLDYDSYRRIQLLYFGNEHQDLTEFILEDLGLFRYERYPLDKANRLFDSAEDVTELLALNDLRTEFYLMNDSKDWSELPTLTRQALALNLPDRLQAKRFRFLNRLAYRLEQMGELTLAHDLFALNDFPPSRERRVRILTKQDKFTEAQTLLQTIHEEPSSSEEIQFYRRFANKLRSKLDLPKLNIKPPAIQDIHESWPRGEGTVEQQACNYFPGAVWLENQLPLAVFGLLHWPVIFADVDGVWHHPFQAAPTDLTDPDFSRKRRELIDELHHQSSEVWRQALTTCWHEKEGIRNPFVAWQKLDLDLILACFDALQPEQWLGIFQHLLADIKQHRSGFPDLFQINEQGYRFIEIKGPGDKLQDNQIGWLTKFAVLNIQAVVCYVQYDDASSV